MQFKSRVTPFPSSLSQLEIHNPSNPKMAPRETRYVEIRTPLTAAEQIEKILREQSKPNTLSGYLGAEVKV